MKTEVYMVEIVLYDAGWGDFHAEVGAEDVVILPNYQQVIGYAKASGLMDIPSGYRVAEVYKLDADGWKSCDTITEDDLE